MQFSNLSCGHGPAIPYYPVNGRPAWLEDSFARKIDVGSGGAGDGGDDGDGVLPAGRKGREVRGMMTNPKHEVAEGLVLAALALPHWPLPTFVTHKA